MERIHNLGARSWQYHLGKLLKLGSPCLLLRKNRRIHALQTGSGIASVSGFYHHLIVPCDPLTSVGLASWPRPTGGQEPGNKVGKLARVQVEQKCPGNCVPGMPLEDLPLRQSVFFPHLLQLYEVTQLVNNSRERDSRQPLNLPQVGSWVSRTKVSLSLWHCTHVHLDPTGINMHKRHTWAPVDTGRAPCVTQQSSVHPHAKASHHPSVHFLGSTPSPGHVPRLLEPPAGLSSLRHGWQEILAGGGAGKAFLG